MNVNERIASLRELMRKHGIDTYYVPNEDDHLSEEYTADYFKCKSFLTGFSGEAGCAVVTKDRACLWTDGRFFTQAEIELEGTEVELMRMGQPGVPMVRDYLIDNTPEGGVLGFDGRVVSSFMAANLEKALENKKAKLAMDYDLAGEVWGAERPTMPKESLWVLKKKYTGETAKERIDRVREAMKEKNADVLILTALEDPCWMLNIRGNDIECTPVSYAFALVTAKTCVYYIDQDKVKKTVAKYFADNGVTVKDYDALEKDLKKLKNKKVWTDLNQLNAYLKEQINDTNTILNMASPVVKFRAVKNEKEMECIRNAHLKDGVAMTKFMYWLKNERPDDLTEMSAQDYLYRLREAQPDYVEPSFPTISAYQENAAMMHYSASEKSNAAVKKSGFLLVDSGGTYLDGSTDITRTFSMGKPKAWEKEMYTLVLKGHVNLARQKFLTGTTGQNLDILARSALWNMGIDYQCGTGHGVGHVLAVHEGPHGISWGFRSRRGLPVALEPGMVVTDEPGVYLPHKFGVRLENELLVVKAEKNFYGQFLEFENLTFCPYDRDAIDPKYLAKEELDWVNAYHKNLYQKLSPYMNAKEKKWLKAATAPIKA